MSDSSDMTHPLFTLRRSLGQRVNHRVTIEAVTLANFQVWDSARICFRLDPAFR